MQTLDQWRCLALLVTILVLLITYPYLLGQTRLVVFYDVLFGAVMMSGLYSVSRTPAQFFSMGSLLLVSMFGKWLELGVDNVGFDAALGLFTAFFFMAMALLVLRHVFSGRTHTGDRLCGALSVYFIMGLAFAEIYRAVYQLIPGAFAFSRPLDGIQLESQFIYLSFVTQTTLGYGDITPSSMAAESLTIIHASSAVLYVAGLVAWLVGSLRPAVDPN
jgi:hypothetical protein